MAAKGKGAGDRTKPVAEQILVDAARIYDARQNEDTDSKDLKTYAGFLSKQDAFTKVSPLFTCDWRTHPTWRQDVPFRRNLPCKRSLWRVADRWCGLAAHPR
jgi:hypothetical protein